MNDVDGRSYKGFSVGVGHLFGITFPLVGVYFKEGKIQYNYSDVPVQKKDSGAKVVQPVDAPVATVPSKGSKSQDPSDTIDALASRENIAT
jgi:hypothetical protein